MSKPLTEGQKRYREYLKSDHWSEMKAEKAKKHKRCCICAASKVHLHHLFYRRPWTASLPSDLRWLCERCHTLVHELQDNGTIVYPKPDNHNSCFMIMKHHVKKHLGIMSVNMFKNQKTS